MMSRKLILYIVSVVALFFIFFLVAKTREIVYSLLILAVLLFILSRFIKSSRVLFFNLGFLMLALGGAETYLIWLHRPKGVVYLRKTNLPGFSVSSETLGFAPKRNSVDTSKGFLGDTLKYKAVYTINENGLRKTPAVQTTSSTKSLVFFGDSFVFGECLNDSEVMPNILQESLGSAYKVYNFGYFGYGTHQMLAAIEHHMVDTIIKFPPKIFIYSAIPDHVNRILGFTYYDFHGPKYVYDVKTNSPVYLGHFDDNKFKYYQNVFLNDFSHFSNLFVDGVRNSKIVSLFRKTTADTTDIKLFAAVVSKSKQLLLQRYPGSEFHVLFWDYNDKLQKAMIRELRENNIQTHLVSDYILDYYPNMKSYQFLPPYEEHPNYKINKLIASCIRYDIIKTPVTDNFNDLTNWKVLNKQDVNYGCILSPSQVFSDKSDLIVSLDTANTKDGVKYKSGELVSVISYKYGEISARMKNNLAPACIAEFNLFCLPDKWWLPSEQDKISFRFSGKQKNEITIITKSAKQQYTYKYKLNFDSGNAFHNYAFLWEKDSVSILIDRKKIYVEKQIPFNERMFVRIGEGLLLPEKGDPPKPGSLINPKQLPSKIYVNYISYSPLIE